MSEPVRIYEGNFKTIKRLTNFLQRVVCDHQLFLKDIEFPGGRDIPTFLASCADFSLRVPKEPFICAGKLKFTVVSKQDCWIEFTQENGITLVLIFVVKRGYGSIKPEGDIALTVSAKEEFAEYEELAHAFQFS